MFLTIPTMALANNDICDYPINDADYFDIPAYELTENDINNLEKIADYLVDDWYGELIQNECIGSDPIFQTDSSPVDLEIKMPFNQRLELKAELDFRQQNKRMYYKRHLMEKRDIIKVVSNQDDAYIITEKAYRNNAHYGTTLVETVYKLLIHDHDNITLDIVIITNGYFSLEQHWFLYR